MKTLTTSANRYKMHDFDISIALHNEISNLRKERELIEKEI